MTIQVEISPETEEWLATQAASQSMDVSTYAAALLEKAKHPVSSHPHDPITPLRRQRTGDQKSLARLFAESPLGGSQSKFRS